MRPRVTESENLGPGPAWAPGQNLIWGPLGQRQTLKKKNLFKKKKKKKKNKKKKNLLKKKKKKKKIEMKKL